jgi:hypothetical protein
VNYSNGARCDGREAVTLYAKGYLDGADLETVFGSDYSNNSDSITDYHEKGKVTIFAGHPLYAAALARC